MKTSRLLSGFRNPVVAVATMSALATNIALWILVALRTQASVEPVPLHYNIYFGIDLLGPWWYTFFFPVIGTAVFIVNGVLTTVLYRKERVAAFFFALASALTELLLLLAAYFSLNQL